MKDYAVKVENISKIYELKNKNNQNKKDKKRIAGGMSYVDAQHFQR